MKVTTAMPITAAVLEPLMLHTPGVSVLKMTGLPDPPPVALTVPVKPTATVGAGLKPMT